MYKNTKMELNSIFNKIDRNLIVNNSQVFFGGPDGLVINDEMTGNESNQVICFCQAV